MNLGRKTINITTPGNEESLRKWFSALLESCLLLSREIGEPWNDERLYGWLAKSRQSASHAYCRVCNCDFKVEHGGLTDATKHSVTESTELNPGCQQPFFVFSSKDTSCQGIRCKEGCKITKKNQH